MILADDVGEPLRPARSASGCGASFSNSVLIRTVYTEPTARDIIRQPHRSGRLLAYNSRCTIHMSFIAYSRLRRPLPMIAGIGTTKSPADVLNRVRYSAM
jgi:hypothetical protein